MECSGESSLGQIGDSCLIITEMTHSASAPALRCIVTAGDHLNTQFIPFIADISNIQFYRNVIFVSYALSLAISAIYNCTVSQTIAGTRHKQCVVWVRGERPV